MPVRKIIEYLSQYAGKKHIFIALLLFLTAEALFIFIFTPSIQSSSGGYGLIDSLAFTSEQAYRAMLTAYTPETRLLHYLSTSLDMIFPLLYGFLIAVVMIRFSQHKVILTTGISIMLLAVFIDYAENVGILFSISHYQHTSVFLIRYLQITTSAKFIFLGLSLFIMIWMVFTTIKKRLNQKFLEFPQKNQIGNNLS
jgi:hypothetical protein